MLGVSSPLLKNSSKGTLTYLVPLFLFLILAGWAFSSPTGSSPDDDYHLSSIWCSAGEKENSCFTVATDQIVVPKNVGEAEKCFAFKTNTSAACTNDIPSDALTVVERENSLMKLYPATFYKTFNIVSEFNDTNTSVLVIRLINAAIASVLLFAVLKLTPVGVKVPYLVAYTLGIVPLGLFIIPSTNPSSWAIVGVSSFWAFATALVWRNNSWRDPQTILLYVLVLFSAVLSIGSRPDSMLYVGAATTLALLYAGFSRIKTNIVPTLYLIVVSFLGLYFFLQTRTPGAGEVMGRHEQNVELLFSNLLQLPLLYEGILGDWALGWNDTPMYGIVPFLGVVLLGGILFMSFRETSLNKTLAVGFAFLVCIAVPLVFLQVEGLKVGEVVQPRYLVPIFFLLLMTLAAGKNPDSSIRFPRNYSISYAVALAFSSILSFTSHLHRYVEGGAPQFKLGSWGSDWSPVLWSVPSLLAYVIVCSIAFYTITTYMLNKTPEESDSLV